jgi:glutamine synthetase
LHVADPTDRNRTSFFVFTGNKFEFRAVGASASCAFPVTVLNSIVADSLQLILDEMEDALAINPKEPLQAKLSVLRKYFKAALPVIFGGNNYSTEWHLEAAERGLPNIHYSFHAFYALQDKKSIRVLENVLDEKELESRFHILVEQYAKTMNIETKCMLEIFYTQIIPSVQSDLRKRFSLFQSAASLGIQFAAQTKIASQMSLLLDEAIGISEEIGLLQEQSKDFGWEAKAKVFCELILPKMDHLRKVVDTLELQTDHDFWPMVKVRELLF